MFAEKTLYNIFGEYTSNNHNISVALDPHGMLKWFKRAINEKIIINSANMYVVNLLPKSFRLSASSEVYNHKKKMKKKKKLS